ncbi:hypothetical protein AKO1_013690 [Acrasis kona]|uniref:N-acetyltransferase domain-containing protein n=1 Tax=Acrasis kona TaxID=1008807 RepID=A0AAW2YVC8_9EUKA
MVVLRVTKKDEERIKDLAALLQSQAIDEKPVEMNAEGELDACRQNLDILDQDNTTWIAIAYMDNTPAGFISITRIPKPNAKNGYLYVDELYTDPNFRRRGVADSLLDYSKTLSKSLNLAGVRLLVRNSNEPAKHCYAKNGFVLSSTTFGQWLCPK